MSDIDKFRNLTEKAYLQHFQIAWQ